MHCLVICYTIQCRAGQSGCNSFNIDYAYTDALDAAALFVAVGTWYSIATNVNCNGGSTGSVGWYVPYSLLLTPANGLLYDYLYIRMSNSDGASYSDGINVVPANSITSIISPYTMSADLLNTAEDASLLCDPNTANTGASVWQAGSTEYIQWNYQYKTGTVSIYWNSGSGWNLIVSGYDMEHTYVWQIPYDIDTTCEMQLQIVYDQDNSAIYTSGYFTMKSPPPLVITDQPDKGAQFIVGNSVTLSWITPYQIPPDAPVSIYTHCTAADDTNILSTLIDTVKNLFQTDYHVATTIAGSSTGSFTFNIDANMVRDCEMVFRLKYGYNMITDTNWFGM